MEYNYTKIIIIGCPASGKTTLANKLGVLLNVPVHHLDKIFWTQKGGIKQDVFIAQQEEMMRGERWIIDGHFWRSKSYDLRLKKADMIILFDFPKYVILWRLFKRTFKNNGKNRLDMPSSHRDKFDWNLIKLIKYIWNHSMEEIYPKILEYSKTKNVVILHNKKEEKEFLDKVKSSTI